MQGTVLSILHALVHFILTSTAMVPTSQGRNGDSKKGNNLPGSHSQNVVGPGREPEVPDPKARL